MSEASLRERARARTESRMTDACTARRKTGEVTDPNSAVVTPTWAAQYSGPCRVKQANPSANLTQVGEAAIVLQQLEVHLPMDDTIPILRPDDEITISASEGDPVSVGRVFLVRGPAGGTGTSARRYAVIERTS